MAKVCDHTSVGLVLIDERFRIPEMMSILMIERHNYPQALALPAGHCDGDDFWVALERESMEEVGIRPICSKLVFGGRVNNPCKREDGSHHVWGVFRSTQWDGEVAAGSDAKRFFWTTFEELRKCAARTEFFIKKYSIDWQDVDKLTKAIFGDPKNPQVDSEWQAEMGLEPVWFFILKKLNYI